MGSIPITRSTPAKSWFPGFKAKTAPLSRPIVMQVYKNPGTSLFGRLGRLRPRGGQDARRTLERCLRNAEMCSQRWLSVSHLLLARPRSNRELWSAEERTRFSGDLGNIAFLMIRRARPGSRRRLRAFFAPESAELRNTTDLPLWRSPIGNTLKYGGGNGDQKKSPALVAPSEVEGKI